MLGRSWRRIGTAQVSERRAVLAYIFTIENGPSCENTIQVTNLNEDLRQGLFDMLIGASSIMSADINQAIQAYYATKH